LGHRAKGWVAAVYMSALNLIGYNSASKKKKRKNNLTNQSSSYRIPKDSARKRKKGLAVARAESGDGRCGGKSYIGRC